MALRHKGSIVKIAYKSVNNTIGLENIQAYILGPTGVKAGPFLLTEEADSDYRGCYSFSWQTSSSHAKGDYLVMVHSPTEGIRAPSIISLIEPGENGGYGKPDPTDVLVFVDNPRMIIQAEKQKHLIINIENKSQDESAVVHIQKDVGIEVKVDEQQ